MKKIGFLILTCMFFLSFYSTSALGKTYHSSFGFSIDLPANWIVFSSETVSKHPDQFLGFKDERVRKWHPSLVEAIKKHVQTGNMEMFYNLDTLDEIHPDRITVAKDDAGLPKSDAEASAKRKELQKELTKWFGMPVEFEVFKVMKLNDLQILYQEYQVVGIEPRFIQYVILKSGNDCIAFTAIAKTQNLDRIRKELSIIIDSFRWEK